MLVPESKRTGKELRLILGIFSDLSKYLLALRHVYNADIPG